MKRLALSLSAIAGTGNKSSSVGVPFDIGSIGSTKIKHWYKDATDPANYIATTTPGFAEQYNEAMNAQHLVQTTEANKPQITGDGMLADGSTLLRKATVPALDSDSGELSFYIVCKINISSVNLSRIIDLNGTNRFVIQYTNSGGNIRFFTYINSVQFLLTAPFDGYLILSCHKTTSRAMIQANDSTIYSEFSMGRITGTDLSVFATNTGGNSMVGHIREFIIGQLLSTNDKKNILYELLRRYRNVTKPITYPKGVELQYNDVTHTYDPAYPGKNIISIATVVADTTDGSTPAANTGGAYDLENNLIIVSGTPGSFVKVSKWNRDLTLNSTTTTQITQGVAYNSETGDYYELLTTGINVKDSANNITKTLTFPSTQPLPGMLFFHQHTKLFYTSYDGGSGINVWTPDFTANTLTLLKTINISCDEGASVSYIDGNLWVNRAGSKIEIDESGNILRSVPVSGNMGVVNEGLIVDPTDNTTWHNSDEFFHGAILNGNRLRHQDEKEVYNKILRIPEQLRYEWGFLSVGLSIVGKYGESYLTGSGTWDSPVIDFGSFTMQQILANYKTKLGISLMFRGSSSAPTTSAINIFPYPFYMNSDGNAWGSTNPGSFVIDPTSVMLRYGQIRIIL